MRTATRNEECRTNISSDCIESERHVQVSGCYVRFARSLAQATSPPGMPALVVWCFGLAPLSSYQRAVTACVLASLVRVLLFAVLFWRSGDNQVVFQRSAYDKLTIVLLEYRMKC